MQTKIVLACRVMKQVRKKLVKVAQINKNVKVENLEISLSRHKRIFSKNSQR